jgi:hypothetical protein
MAYSVQETVNKVKLLLEKIGAAGFIDVVKIDVGSSGNESGPVCAANPLPVTAPSAIPVSGTVAVTDSVPLTVTGAGGTFPISVAAPLSVRRADAAQVGAEAEPAWANSAGVLTEVDTAIDLTGVAISPHGGIYIIVKNPSTETALAGELLIEWKEGATARFGKLAAFTIAQNNGAGGEVFIFDGALSPGKLRLALKNSSALGGGGAFKAHVQIWAF